jgi:branched-chain amino acid transport system ATP-binding protein
VVVLDHGEVIAEGKPAEIRQNEAVLRAYLGRTSGAGEIAGVA